MTIPITPLHTFVFEGVRTQVYSAAENEGLIPHQHSYEHLTVCYAGRCRVRIQDHPTVIELSPQDQPLLLPRNRWHEITALEDSTVFANMFSSLQVEYSLPIEGV